MTDTTNTAVTAKTTDATNMTDTANTTDTKNMTDNINGTLKTLTLQRQLTL